MLKITPLAIVISLAACASSNPAAIQGVDVATQETVARCKYLDTIIGSSSLYGVFAERGIENARASAVEKAKHIGGTHIVWEQTAPSQGTSQVAAKVYRCAN